MRNWKTTVWGILSILAAIGNVANSLLGGTTVDWNAAGTAIAAGIGLIVAADAKPVAK